jgi:hypothetical protein
MNQRAVGLSDQQVGDIPTVAYVPGMSEVEEPTCSICLTDYEAGERLRVLPCRHVFHRECLDPWLARNANCPNCRTNLLPGDDGSSDSEEGGGRGTARDGGPGAGTEVDLIRQHLQQGRGGGTAVQQSLVSAV